MRVLEWPFQQDHFLDVEGLRNDFECSGVSRHVASVLLLHLVGLPRHLEMCGVSALVTPL